MDLIDRWRILLPLSGFVAVLSFAVLAECTDAISTKMLLGIGAAIFAGATIGTYVAGNTRGVLSGIFGAFFWGICSPTIVLVVFGSFFFPFVAVLFRRESLDAVFSRLPSDIFTISFAALGILAGSYVGGRISRRKMRNES